MEYRSKLSDLGIDVHKIRGNQGAVICPKCSHTRKKKKDPCLSVNIDEGVWKCHHCDWSGSVRFEDKPKKQYVRPVFVNKTDLSKEVVDWFGMRGISQKTIMDLKITQGSGFFPQVGETRSCINFNYFRGDDLINIKYRDHEKNFMLHKDAELIFYGLEMLDRSMKTITIVEGEADRCAAHESGLKNILSVPNGANKRLDYLDNCWGDIEFADSFVLAVDNDDAGMILREELSRRIGKDKCFKVDFKDQKDANDYLIKYGPESLASVLSKENWIEYPIRGVVDIDDIWADVEHIMDNGLDRGDTTGVFSDLDEHISFDGSKLCVVTGMPNAGKSPFVDMIMIILSIRFGWKWGICSMENKPLKMYVVKLAEKIIGKFIRPKHPISQDQKVRVKRFIQDHFFFIESNYEGGESDTLDFILTAAKDLVRKHGIKGLTIDPWNKIEHDMKPGENETNYVSRALDKIIRFEQVHDLFTFLIAHPTKQKRIKKDEYEVPDLYSVSGSSNFFNKPDWGITVHRNYTTGFTEVYFNKVKWDHLGKRGTIAMQYNPGNGRLGDHGSKLDFSNWLDSLVFIDSKKTEQVIDYDYLMSLENVGVPDKAPF